MHDQYSEHEQAWQLLPWYLNGTLEKRQFDTVEAHLGCCLVCRQELQRLRTYAAAVNSEDALQVDPERAFDRLMGRIAHTRESGKNKARRPHRDIAAWWRSRARPRLAAPAALAWALPALLLVAVTVFWLPDEQTALYTTLTDSAPVGGADGERRLRAVFERNATVAELNALLTACRSGIVSGPTSADAYTLRFNPDQTEEAALQCLRRKSQVVLAEPVFVAHDG